MVEVDDTPGLADVRQTRFVIIGWPRTGSTHLTSLLNEQAGIACHGEIFHPKNVFARWPNEQTPPQNTAELMALRDRDPHGFLDHVCALSLPSRQVGFKMFPGHNDDLLEELIADDSIRKVVLYRGNLLASYSSTLIKRETPAGTRRARSAPPPLVEFNAQRFVVYTKRHSAFYTDVITKLNNAGQSFFMVHYEQINDPWLLASLVTFIGGDIREIVTTGGKRKLNSSAILSRFVNEGEAAEFLSGHNLTGWQHETQASLDPFGYQSESG